MPRCHGGVPVEPSPPLRPSIVIGAALLVPPIACAVLSLFRAGFANTNAALVLVLVVVAAAATGIRTAGIAAALSAAVWFDFFLTAPFQNFAILDPTDIETAVLLVLVGLAVTEVALWGRRQQARASREQGYLDGVVGTAASIGAGNASTEALVERVGEQIAEVVGLDRCRFDTGTDPVLATLDDTGAMTYDRHPYDVDRLGLPTDTEVELAVRSHGVVRGRFLLTAATRVVRPSPEQLRVAGALANQVGAALAADQGADGDQHRLIS
jgi:hypothetical protein